MISLLHQHLTTRLTSVHINRQSISSKPQIVSGYDGSWYDDNSLDNKRSSYVSPLQPLNQRRHTGALKFMTVQVEGVKSYYQEFQSIGLCASGSRNAVALMTYSSKEDGKVRLQ